VIREDPVLAGAPPRPWRLSGRLLVIDPADRLLLVRCHDPVAPVQGEWWEVPGGGVDPGEDTVTAALREVAEETGVRVPRGAVLPGRWEQDITYEWLGVRRWSRHVVHIAALRAVPAAVPLAPTADERLSFLGASWVPIAEVDGLPRTYPDGIAELIPRLLDGAEIDAGFAIWS